MNWHIFTKVKLFPGHNYRPLPPKRTGNSQKGPEIARKWPKMVTKPVYSGSIFEKTSAETKSKNLRIKKFRFYRWFRSALNHDTITCQNHARSPLPLCNCLHSCTADFRVFWSRVKYGSDHAISRPRATLVDSLAPTRWALSRSYAGKHSVWNF